MPTADVSFAFRPLREDNLTLLHHWLHRPHVTYWWGGEDETFEDTRQTYLPRLKEGSSIKSYVAVVAGEPIGFIQSYVALGSADGWWQEETDPGVRGIDQFLIEGSMLGQGIGSRMVGQFVRLLFEDAAVTRVQTDPDPTNTRAIRCYEKAGFHAIGQIVTPDGPAMLMVIERPVIVR